MYDEFMGRRKKKVTQIATQDLSETAKQLGRRGGLKGGPARAKKMTAEERSESARKASQARWAKAKKAKPKRK